MSEVDANGAENGAVARTLVRLVSANQSDRDQRQTKRPSQATDTRSHAAHDRDRIYYSTAFRRLAGVTQVVTPVPDAFTMHNRLTHSLKVAQVARSIAGKFLKSKDREFRRRIADLGGLDVDVVEAAALAHDLGHPPFGHIGEDVLDDYARTVLDLSDGFEGNAQSFRIVSRLEPRSERHDGLNLTRAVRSAVLKYPWFRATRRDDHNGEKSRDLEYRLQWKKFGAYHADSVAFEDARVFLVPTIRDQQTLEAAIMDVADDITYAIHDLEDFFAGNLLGLERPRDAIAEWLSPDIPSGVENFMEQLALHLGNDYPGLFLESTFRAAGESVNQTLEGLILSVGGPSWSVKAQVRVATSALITAYIDGLRLNAEAPSIERPALLVGPEHWHALQILKEITQRYVIQRSDLAVVQRGQQKLLLELLGCLKSWCDDEKEKYRLPAVVREQYEASGGRAIVDFVASLSDHQTISLHHALTGSGPSSLAASFV